MTLLFLFPNLSYSQGILSYFLILLYNIIIHYYYMIISKKFKVIRRTTPPQSGEVFMFRNKKVESIKIIDN